MILDGFGKGDALIRLEYGKKLGLYTVWHRSLLAEGINSKNWNERNCGKS